MGKKKKLKAAPLQGATVAEIISQLQNFPPDAVLVFQDGNGGIRTIEEITQGKCYHAYPGAEWIGQYSFVSQENWDNPQPKDAEHYQKPHIQTSLRDAVEFS